MDLSQQKFDEITIGADPREARRASEWLESACRQSGVPQVEVDRLMLCLEEVVSNIIDHGGQTARSGPVRVQFAVEPLHGGNTAQVTVSDAGKPFDPVSAPIEKLPATLDEALPRGRGLLLIRQCCSSLHYRREGGQNHLTFGTRWSADSNRA